MSGPITTSLSTGITDTGDSETETGEDGRDLTSDCDPLADLLTECGPNQACDVETLECVPATGSASVDEACADTSECAPGLVCADQRCQTLCDPSVEGDDECADGRICTYADEPLPGLCAEPCELVTQACSIAGDACNRGLGPGPEPVAVCTVNPGAGVEGDACQLDGDCFPGYLCTPAQLHTSPCAGDADFCCTPICDLLILPCFGLEPNCYPIGIEGQDSAGYCGVF
ncbi:hypothetical protein [Enhygromyxa salina]|uniref:hypothetical protein n=1 Tax=Enhygromyxa salina TaxID=215803 RepID=UPI000D08B8DB|nr:hypothetical protein [Enhygromyxa salina]